MSKKTKLLELHKQPRTVFVQREHYLIKQADKNVGEILLADADAVLVLAKINIEKQFRNKGFGRETLAVLLDFAAQTSCKGLLILRATNYALLGLVSENKRVVQIYGLAGKKIIVSVKSHQDILAQTSRLQVEFDKDGKSRQLDFRKLSSGVWTTSGQPNWLLEFDQASGRACLYRRKFWGKKIVPEIQIRFVNLCFDIFLPVRHHKDDLLILAADLP
ncbi:MAG: hypothetical protein LBJ25_05995 [Candidatus Margulisbacteria bacterium]|nr:hypothetical protein [Candidatus Margulisiibacteriota bacterium]